MEDMYTIDIPVEHEVILISFFFRFISKHPHDTKRHSKEFINTLKSCHHYQSFPGSSPFPVSFSSS
jgi:hypothetical protein